MIQVKSFFHEGSNTVSHLIWHTPSAECAVIDPVLDFDPASARTSTESADEVLDYIDQHNLRPKYLLETHVHADHLSAAPYLKQMTKAPIMIGENITQVIDAFNPIFNLPTCNASRSVTSYFDRLLKDTEVLPLGDQSIRVMSTPGHTAGCVTYTIADMAFVGDTLFMPDFGTARADFPGGDAHILYRSIMKILSLPDATKLYMCHDYKAPGRDEYAWETTVAEQRNHNIHLKDSVDEEQYVRFRESRDKTLAVPALLLMAVQVNLCAGQLPEPESNGISYLKLPIDQF